MGYGSEEIYVICLDSNCRRDSGQLTLSVFEAVSDLASDSGAFTINPTALPVTPNQHCTRAQIMTFLYRLRSAHPQDTV